MRKIAATIILSAYLLTGVRAQHEIGLKAVGGYLVAHHTVMQYLVETHAVGLEAYYEKEASGEKDWHKLYRYPDVGVSMFMGSPGNRDIIGNSYSIVPYIKFHPALKKVFRFNIKCGMGLGYLQKFFDKTDNNKNTAIGSHFNIAFNMGFECEWRLKKFDIGTGITFMHFSNGAWKVPNLGYNIPMLHIMAGRRFGKHPEKLNEDKVYDKSSFEKKLSYSFVYNSGVKERLPVEGPKYYVCNLSISANYHLTPMSMLMVSSETFYNQAYIASLESFYKISVKPAETIRTGIAISYALMVGSLGMYIQNGFYLYDKYRDFDGSFFHRMGVKYVFDNGFTLHAAVKTHFAKADNLDFGVGYTIGKRR